MIVFILSLIVLGESSIQAAICYPSTSVTDHSNGSVSRSIQDCIDDLVRDYGGGTVQLATGTYYTQGSIILDSDITIKGNGTSSSIIRYNGTGSDDILTNDDYSVTNVTIRDLAVQGSGHGSGGNQICIYIGDDEGGTNEVIYLRYVKATECPQYGIHIKGADGVLVMYPSLSYNGSSSSLDHNLYFRRVANAKVELGSSNYAAGNGLNFTDCEDVQVRNFTTRYNGQNGVRIAGGSNRIELYALTSAYNTESGVEFRTETSNPQNGCVRSSTLSNNSTWGIYMRTLNGYEFTSNTYSGNASGTVGNYSSWSTAASGVCSSIPSDSSAYPFTR